MLLALDISSSIIGWSLWKEGRLADQGFELLTNYKGEPKELAERLDAAVISLIDICKDFEITKIAAEAAMQKFSGGSTTANTLFKLIAMNFGLTYTLSRLWDSEVEYIPVNAARKLVGIKIPRQQKGIKKDPNWTKRHVIEAVALKYPSLIFPKTASGKHKKGYDDLADSIVIGEAAHAKK